MNKFLATALVAVLLVGVVAMPASALSLVNDYKGLKEGYKNAKNEYLDAKNSYETAKNEYKRLRNAAALSEKTVNYLNKAINYAVSYLAAVNKGLENAGETKYSSLIGGYINWFQAEQTQLQNAKTIAQVKGEAKKIKDEWNDVKKNVKKIMLEIAIDRTQTVLDKADALSKRTDNKIEARKAAGGDVGNAETLLAKFDARVADAKAKLASAREAYQQVSTAEEAAQLLKQAHGFLKEANSDLRLAYAALKDLRNELRNKGITQTTAEAEAETEGKKKTLKGSGWVNVTGTGTIDFRRATGYADFTVGANGSFSVVGEATVEADSTWNETAPGFYEGYGHAGINGTSLSVSLSGADVSFYAEGSGKLRMSGTGTYAKGGAGLPGIAAQPMAIAAAEPVEEEMTAAATAEEPLPTPEPSSKTFTGTGILKAKGDGTAVITGNVRFSGTALKAGGATIIVTDNEGDALIVIPLGVGTRNDYGNGTVEYSGVGHGTIEGSDVSIVFSGTELNFVVHGTGTATLSGTGTYAVHKRGTTPGQALTQVSEGSITATPTEITVG